MASITVGSIFGIPIKLGLSFLLVVPLLAYLIGAQVAIIAELLGALMGTPIDPQPLSAGPIPWLLGLTAALGLFGSVLVHELGHALVARRYGLETESITLWFLGGLAQFRTFPKEWHREFAIAVAGPIVSVALGIAFYLSVLVAPPTPALVFVFGYLAILNVALAVFNMLPGFPMDGGRVLRALLSRNRSRVEATRIAAGVGKAFALLLGVAGILTLSIFWVAIAFFIYLAATSEAKQVVLEAAFEGLTVRELMTPAADLHTVSPDLSLADLADRMLDERHTGYPVLEDDRLIGIVTLEDLESRADGTVREVMSTDPVTISLEADATDALQTLTREDVGRLLVVEDDHLVGLVSRTDLMTVLEITQAATPNQRERDSRQDRTEAYSSRQPE